jgi:hypothetical protein
MATMKEKIFIFSLILCDLKPTRAFKDNQTNSNQIAQNGRNFKPRSTCGSTLIAVQHWATKFHLLKENLWPVAVSTLVPKDRPAA